MIAQYQDIRQRRTRKDRQLSIVAFVSVILYSSPRRIGSKANKTCDTDSRYANALLAAMMEMYLQGVSSVPGEPDWDQHPAVPGKIDRAVARENWPTEAKGQAALIAHSSAGAQARKFGTYLRVKFGLYSDLLFKRFFTGPD